MLHQRAAVVLAPAAGAERACGRPASSMRTCYPLEMRVAEGVRFIVPELGQPGAVADCSPWLALIATVTLQSAALLGLYALGHQQAAAVALIALAGLAFAAFTATLGGLVLLVAPGRSDLAAATVSAAVNVGITAGAFVGG